MKLYFEDSKDKKKLIAKPRTEEDTYKIINEFCENRHIKIHYIKDWMKENGFRVFDIGKHLEFFLLDYN